MRNFIKKWDSVICVLLAGIILGIALVLTLTNGKLGVWDVRSVAGMGISWVAGIALLAVGVRDIRKGR